ncbi:hypothetical protein KR018_002979 [Drosophila ironensis]|nr:hypothetical protein KR018_002979 [Drosophila ironensis]
MWQQMQLADTPNWTGAEGLHQFWGHLRVQHRFRTLLYYRLNSCECWMEQQLRGGNASTMVWDDKEYPHFLRKHQDDDLLVVLCLGFVQYPDVLNALSVMLDQLRSVPVVMQLCDSGHNPIQELAMASEILQLGYKFLMINILLLSSSFYRSNIYYTFDVFPKFKLIKSVFRPRILLFPQKLANLGGYAIRTLADNSEPHTIVRKSADGEIIISGPIWQLLEEFIRNLNGTIHRAIVPPPGNIIKLAQVVDLVRNNTVDVAATLRPFTLMKNYQQYSYPAITGSWCTMLPMERVLSSHNALGSLMQSPLTWVYLLLLYVAHRLLSQRRFLQARVFAALNPMAHLLLVCILQAQLSAFFIEPQQMNHITSLRQLEQSGLRIMGNRAEFSDYPIEMRSRYASSFLLKDVFNDLAQHRNSFNTSYGYTVTSIKWMLYKEVQSYFHRPLFRYSNDICVQKLSLFSLVIRKNFLLRYQLKHFILRLHAGGLLRFWYRQSYHEMIQAGRMRLEDMSTPHQFQPISWSEWQYVTIFYGAALVASLGVFVVELAVYYVNVCLENL